ncbi:Arc family DNA-binding protein [Gluconacetobacter diazotrophicus]|uniref:Arc family DNA-binding protein n=1 Tax=Gluconacetobacter diazotrophicus TaxID=33996 RepID=A0A7W4NFY5_GLUDI|nr:Arc family DNA-binding protein [Gluconacetobacter diazotrophicus]MBB2157032.1 Arc family DNA-binding protein [Gluconacetobacter diazotrophicus]
MSDRYRMPEASRVYLRIPPDLREWLEARASGRVRSLNAHITDLLEEAREQETAARNAGKLPLAAARITNQKAGTLTNG